MLDETSREDEAPGAALFLYCVDTLFFVFGGLCLCGLSMYSKSTRSRELIVEVLL